MHVRTALHPKVLNLDTDDDDGAYSEEEDFDEVIDWALAVDVEEAERAALEGYHFNFGGGYSGGHRASAIVLYSRVVDGGGRLRWRSRRQHGVCGRGAGHGQHLVGAGD
jgi:hypothetical protein